MCWKWLCFVYWWIVRVVLWVYWWLSGREGNLDERRGRDLVPDGEQYFTSFFSRFKPLHRRPYKWVRVRFLRFRPLKIFLLFCLVIIWYNLKWIIVNWFCSIHGVSIVLAIDSIRRVLQKISSAYWPKIEVGGNQKQGMRRCGLLENFFSYIGWYMMRERKRLDWIFAYLWNWTICSTKLELGKRGGASILSDWA